MAEYAEYHHAMAQHAAALSNSNQLHPVTMSQLPMLSAAGLNLTVSSPIQVMSGGLANNNAGQHHLGQVTPAGHHVMYQNVQTTNAGGGGGGVPHPQNQAGPILHHHGSNKKQKKPKVNKDGVPAPKRATTAYINFTQWYREELKKTGRPIPKIGDFGKECAQKWNSMNDEEKQPFLDVAAKDRDRYKKEMAIYKPARDANKPKRPGTAFMLFMADFRKQMAGKEPEGGVAALAKLGGERWRGMNEEDKRPYVDKQNEEKLRYEASMEDYRRKSAGSLTTGPTVKQARLSTEGSDGGSGVDSDSGDHLNQEQSKQEQQQSSQTMLVRQQQNVNAPSPATSSSSPQTHTMSPSPLPGSSSLTGQQQSQQVQVQQQQQQQIAQSVANSNNVMTSLPSLNSPMSITHAITTPANAIAITGYPQHTFATNFGHPASTGAHTVAAVNYNQTPTSGMSTNSPSYLQTGAGTTYTAQSHLPGHYTWN